jgi:hypothetical protein
MKCKCLPNSPFHWKNDPRPSIFLLDHVFRAKGGSGLTTSQIASVVVDDKRKEGKMSGSIRGLGKATKDKEAALIAYKQFGIYSRAKPNIKPQLNKHEVPKGRLD